MNYFYDKYQKKLTKRGLITIGVLLLLLLIFLFFFIFKEKSHNKILKHPNLTQNSKTKKPNSNYMDSSRLSFKEKEENTDESLFQKYQNKLDKNFVREFKNKEKKFCSESQGIFNTSKEAKILDLNNDGIICDGKEQQKTNSEKVAKLTDIKTINNKIEDVAVVTPKEVTPVLPAVLPVVEEIKPVVLSTPSTEVKVENKPTKKQPRENKVEPTQYKLNINNNIQSSYKIRNLDTQNIIIKESNSAIELNLDKGKYEISQIKTADGYILNTSMQNIEIIDKDLSISFVNDKIKEMTNDEIINSLKSLVKESQLDKKSKISLIDLINSSNTLPIKDLFSKVNTLVIDLQLKEKINVLQRKIPKTV